jgi:prepilin-type N-terminal cleavage/methylation domain-containing protein
MNLRKRGILQRGYSLIEMAIVLAVMGLLLGGALLPFAAKVRSENYREVDDAIEVARAAVVSYAMRNRTIARAISVNGRLEVIPAGRPYLPCPDINGDGVEDRNDEADVLEALRDSVYNPFSGAVSVTLEFSPASGSSPPDYSSFDDHTLLKVGVCQENKGVLPWLTLGVPPTDKWGNRFTYRVDPAFSSLALGFDETSRADDLDVRRQITPVNVGGNIYFSYARRDTDGFEQPMLICDDVPCTTTNAAGRGRIIAGVITESALSPASQPRAYNANDVVDGIPFAIVSHGQNGSGAVSHFASDSATGDLECLLFDEGESRIDREQQNANRRTAFGGCPAIDAASSTQRAHLISILRHESGDSTFDDVVVWMSAAELIGELARNGVLPVEKLPY